MFGRVQRQGFDVPWTNLQRPLNEPLVQHRQFKRDADSSYLRRTPCRLNTQPD
jgi:hypothetical protein